MEFSELGGKLQDWVLKIIKSFQHQGAVKEWTTNGTTKELHTPPPAS